jgi:hypothetical protein
MSMHLKDIDDQKKTKREVSKIVFTSSNEDE